MKSKQQVAWGKDGNLKDRSIGALTTFLPLVSPALDSRQPKTWKGALARTESSSKGPFALI